MIFLLEPAPEPRERVEVEDLVLCLLECIPLRWGVLVLCDTISTRTAGVMVDPSPWACGSGCDVLEAVVSACISTSWGKGCADRKEKIPGLDKELSNCGVCTGVINGADATRLGEADRDGCLVCNVSWLDFR